MPTPDSSIAFLADGYLFGHRRFLRMRSDAFRTRIMGRPAVVMHGSEAARIFYEGDRFTRDRAMPTSVLHLLQDEGSVQSLAGAVHHHRKSLFARMLTDDDALRRLRELYADEWFRAMADWSAAVILHEKLITVLTRVAVRWVGINPDTVDIPARAGELAGMIENAGKFGPPNWLARQRRHRTERWAGELIAGIWNGDVLVDPGSPLAQLAHHTELDGSRLDQAAAAVELINLLRPIVAVGRFIVFAALALHVWPSWRRVFASGDTADVGNFVQEVRRYYPFFPVIGGRAQHGFEWHGHRFEIGDWVLLDLFATNRDERSWSDPGRFQPERFRDWTGDPNTLIPQGGGDLIDGHRCPGERATIELMEEAVHLLSRATHYAVPPQDLRVSLRRFPALPESGFVMDAVGPAVSRTG
ncbi:fatty-acid peroxygenase [Homoserinimonas aerilata]|uniref:Fatty-acid peroxygenase n=1 Tax=Homoserinimonas aerilata TaxID=1162970 RepID=A0A542YH41_9MICO|nr:cytochrome P450 [Homoserinimonas aerilata]TQL47413.1 fatty-acid peroxygenase [Homoserinimonas aerilata]